MGAECHVCVCSVSAREVRREVPERAIYITVSTHSVQCSQP